MNRKSLNPRIACDTLNIRDVVTSPAVPAFVLLHGIVILFATTFYMDIQWERLYTVGFFALALVWGAITVSGRFREKSPILNRIDLMFVAFLLAVSISVAIYWWDGSIKQLQQMPFFLLTPYILGRAMRAEDGFILRGLLVFMGPAMAVLIFPEYLRYMNYGYEHVNSPYPILFAKNISGMMSGLLLAFSLLSLVSILLTNASESTGQSFGSVKARYFTYVVMAGMLLALVWMSSRGPLLIAIIGMCVLLILTPTSSRRRKIEILLVVGLSLAIAFAGSFNRKASRDHYGHLFQSPVMHGGQVETKAISSKQVIGGISILGPSACDHIVDSVSERWIHIQQAITLLIQNPLSGVGANQYGFHSCQGPGAFPHNVLLQVFAELGVAVGVLYSCLLWMAVRVPLGMSRAVQKNTWGLLGSWFTAFSIMQVIFALVSGDYFLSAPVYFVMGLAASMLDSSLVAETH